MSLHGSSSLSTLAKCTMPVSVCTVVIVQSSRFQTDSNVKPANSRTFAYSDSTSCTEFLPKRSNPGAISRTPQLPDPYSEGFNLSLSPSPTHSLTSDTPQIDLQNSLHKYTPGGSHRHTDTLHSHGAYVRATNITMTATSEETGHFRTISDTKNSEGSLFPPAIVRAGNLIAGWRDTEPPANANSDSYSSLLRPSP